MARETAESGVDVVCWDWNGTLLNDVDIARAAMNSVLAEHRLPLLGDELAYRRSFGFPVQDFYQRLGIGAADFRLAATRYLELFAAGIGRAVLQRGHARCWPPSTGVGCSRC